MNDDIFRVPRNDGRPDMAKFMGHLFKTRLEGERARELYYQQKAGAVRGLVFHPRVKITDADLPYTADFGYTQHGQPIWEDFKTEKNPRFKDIARLWPVYGPGVLRITRRFNGKTEIVKEIQGKEVIL